MNALARIAWNWGAACFGLEHMHDPKNRSIRLVEEAVELCQAVGVDAELIKTIVDDVYVKPPGEPLQELGGCLVTASVMAYTLGMDPEEVLEKEVTRVVLMPKEHFTRRNQSKRTA
jgi:NTP pyrophosphatase (non-canonical NTP hydrolase)